MSEEQEIHRSADPFPEPARRHPRRAWLLGAGVAVAVVAGAVAVSMSVTNGSPQSSRPRIASAATGGPTGGPTPVAPDAAKYQKCLADHGMDLGTPVPGQPHNLNGQDVGGALHACEALAPPAANVPADPKMKQAALAVAKCMRDAGYTDFPDPDVSGSAMAMGMTNPPNDAKYAPTLDTCMKQSGLGGGISQQGGAQIGG